MEPKNIEFKALKPISCVPAEVLLGARGPAVDPVRQLAHSHCNSQTLIEFLIANENYIYKLKKRKKCITLSNLSKMEHKNHTNPKP